MSIATDHLSSLADPHRLQVLASINLDDPRLREELDLLATRTAQDVGLPISMITLVLDSAQLLAGAYGVDGWIAAAGGTPAEWAFCARTVIGGRPYLVPDAVNDPVQAGNPLVTQVGFGSYAGVPIVVDGEVLGAHCVIDTAAHEFTDADVAKLQQVSAEVTGILERYRTASS